MEDNSMALTELHSTLNCIYV